MISVRPGESMTPLCPGEYMVPPKKCWNEKNLILITAF